jgi:hypothetical protein
MQRGLLNQGDFERFAHPNVDVLQHRHQQAADGPTVSQQEE